MSTVSPGSNLFQQETVRVLSDGFNNEGLETKLTSNSARPSTPAQSPAQASPSSVVPGDQPLSKDIDPAVAPITTDAAPDVDMASFFSIDNLEISEDKDGKTTVDGVPFLPVGDHPQDKASSPIKQRAKSETLDTLGQKPRAQNQSLSVPHSPRVRSVSDKSSTLRALNGATSESLGAAAVKGDAPRVSAYARLDFQSFTFYVQTLQVILGRRPEHGANLVDVDLGVAKAISRRHAKIYYNFGTQRFELSVLGRNGAFVDDSFVDTGSTVPLKDGYVNLLFCFAR